MGRMLSMDLHLVETDRIRSMSKEGILVDLKVSGVLKIVCSSYDYGIDRSKIMARLFNFY